MRLAALLLATVPIWAQGVRKVDPTFLRQYIPEVPSQPVDVTTEACRYKPIFGGGIARGVVRFAEITVHGGACNRVSYAAEEQVYVVMEGSGTLQYGDTVTPVKRHDFMYLPATIKHGISGTLRLFVMGFRVPPNTAPPQELLIANFDDVQKQTVGGHPDSVVYQLMMGDTNSKRDRIAAGHLLTSLYVMEFAPGGTNFPHHHDSEEEIYVLLDGNGQMVAGSGLDGVEARFPARPGDAYFFRLNCTVGFYNGQEGPAHILAVRSLYPRR
jgi:mannose-6-phosphate isomerase-like protein (cupin superfamily)